MATGSDVLEKSAQETNVWLNEIEQRLDIADRRKAFGALRATLHAVRDRIGADHALQLAARLPLLIKGLFFENWQPSEMPTREREKDTFVANVDAAIHRGLGVDPEQAVRVVLEVLAAHYDPAEIDKLRGLFPEDMRDLWPQPAVRRPARRAPRRTTH